jgi:hypothetical protein
MKKFLFMSLMFTSLFCSASTVVERELVFQHADGVMYSVPLKAPKIKASYIVRLAKQIGAYSFAGIFGFITGLTSGFIDMAIFGDMNVFLPITGIFIEPGIRRAILEDFCDEIGGNGSEDPGFNKNRRVAMGWCARVASWAGYLLGLAVGQSRLQPVYVVGYCR